MIGDGLDFQTGTVLCYTPAVSLPHAQTWYRLLTHPVSLGRALTNNDGRGAAFIYVLEQIDKDTHQRIQETEDWHVQSEFLRAYRKLWKRWDAAANSLKALEPND